MRERVLLDKPTLFVMLGLPGSGKTFTARQLSGALGVLHYQADEYRAELFDKLEHTPDQDDIVDRLTLLNLSKLIDYKKSIIVDADNFRWSFRKQVRDLAKKANYNFVIIWVQTDANTSFARSNRRDRRTPDSRFAVEVSGESFDKLATSFSKPRYEDYIVISGKHAFKTQLASIVRKLKMAGMLRVVAAEDQRLLKTRKRISLSR